ncbi:MAG: hypothetical protein [Caudoviricetes sp.]|nr:MAG: hypothetical protein [Caudoviricetes sp.]
MSECIDHGRYKSLTSKGQYLLVKHPNKKSRCVTKHRLVYADKLGVDIAELSGVVVRHTCDNSRCINPEHLVGGTLADNNKDRAERGRSAKAVPSRRKLTQAQAEAIRTRYNPKRVGIRAPDGVSQLARDYSVDTGTILNILRELTHV